MFEGKDWRDNIGRNTDCKQGSSRRPKLEMITISLLAKMFEEKMSQMYLLHVRSMLSDGNQIYKMILQYTVTSEKEKKKKRWQSTPDPFCLFLRQKLSLSQKINSALKKIKLVTLYKRKFAYGMPFWDLREIFQEHGDRM